MTKKKQSTEAAVREIRRRTRRKFAPEEKVRIVLEGLRGEQSISELCRREGIASNLYYRWSKDFLEAGKKQLAATPCAKPPATKSRICGPRTGSSRKSSPRSRSKIRAQKKSDGSWRGGRHVRRTASEKMEIIRWSTRRICPFRVTLRQLGVPRSTFYDWYQRYEAEGFDGLEDKKPRARPCWNTIPKDRSGPSARLGARAHRPVTAGAGLSLHRRKALLRIGIERLSHLEGSGSHHEPGLRADVGLGCLQEPNDTRA